MRLFSTRMSRPFRYACRKILANHFRAVLAPHQMPRTPNILRPPHERIMVASYSIHSYSGTESMRQKSTVSKPAHAKAEVYVKSLAESRPVFERAPGQPAAVKSNGGLRGSKATRWR